MFDDGPFEQVKVLVAQCEVAIPGLPMPLHYLSHVQLWPSGLSCGERGTAMPTIHLGAKLGVGLGTPGAAEARPPPTTFTRTAATATHRSLFSSLYRLHRQQTQLMSRVPSKALPEVPISSPPRCNSTACDDDCTLYCNAIAIALSHLYLDLQPAPLARC
ncbi:uncharacterized protein EI97DRAFT_289494 [Westerdykella ornata]|uniref:Uncharacterized protein n=1 Tax=Westerdykella ornata TaxID=318751 RepID=A0A6A6JNW8_WESOR|nr:uncharacterized protein EI97DRAFT_289494 [Westerdykella ornata]KAF2277376.1 hypothetical protein EI97DRAFT_289494 [Westerdykella ornata]